MHLRGMHLRGFFRFCCDARFLICLLFFLPAWQPIFAQAQPETSGAAPKAPADTEFLASYEGQNVSSIEVAGRPGLTSAQFSQFFVQQVGQPFSKDNVEKTAAALKTGGHFDQVETEVEPELDENIEGGDTSASDTCASDSDSEDGDGRDYRDIKRMMRVRVSMLKSKSRSSMKPKSTKRPPIPRWVSSAKDEVVVI